MSLEQKLKNLQERERAELKGKIDEVEQRYASAPTLVNGVAELLGIPAEQFITICTQTARHYKDMKWYDILEIVRSFQVTGKRLEEENKAQGPIAQGE